MSIAIVAKVEFNGEEANYADALVTMTDGRMFEVSCGKEIYNEDPIHKSKLHSRTLSIIAGMVENWGDEKLNHACLAYQAKSIADHGG